MNGIDLAKRSDSVPEGPIHTTDITIVSWNGPDDPQDPFNWPSWKKWWATGLGLLASFICSMNGTILSVAHEDISEEFHISDATFPHSYWLTTSWGLGAALCPLILFPIMEDFGVRPVLLSTYFVFACFLVPVGFAHNYVTLIIVRFISGGCVPLMSDAVASMASNVFHGDRARSIPISLYVTIYLGSTSIGPVIGAAILKFLSWRWIGYMETIWTAAAFPLFALGLPETRGSAILRVKAKSFRSDGKNAYTAAELELDRTPSYQVVIKSMKRPLYMLVTELVVFVAALWAAFSLGTIYLFTQSVEQVYAELYGWDAVKAGYVQVAIVIGEILGCLICISTDHWYHDSAFRNIEIPGVPIPEARLYSSIIGGLLGATGGMFVYGWTSYPSVHWSAPTVGLAMVGFGTTAVIIGNANYLIDAYSKYAASALGAVGLVENIAIAFLPLATTAMYTVLGFQWASSALAFVSLVLVATPLVMLRWGTAIRSRSPFMREAIIDRRRGSIQTGNI
ncbi:major facilitator superfamily domain-containing protein [Aspergillus pseudonomiae]|uniref:Major facilitator superfamily domain-containing protein n=1 Tax=Aspergillus pseudonomiae TaxID=1506151 RepID=A0A5N7CU25_9EURO|nr:major facilitator superfamily domain-containing protein [Aspergillus pseudonomiae]KAE8397654.1 major facilitator superfamily domain-containing protein [Aspergillus pseudonomiae]